jgi:hypothetical protein
MAYMRDTPPSGAHPHFTVKELIDILSKYDPTVVVHICVQEMGYMPILEVSENDSGTPDFPNYPVLIADESYA